MRKLLSLFLSLVPIALSAQVAEDYKGGWITEIDGVSHVYHIVMRDGEVSGFYCHDCEKPVNLAFIDDGRLNAEGLEFLLYHYPKNADAFHEKVTAVRTGESLRVVRQHEDLSIAPINMVMQRQAPDPALDSLPVKAGPPAGRELIRPGELEVVTPEKVLGVWLWGAGPGKQIFTFRKHKDGIRGMVCGPCDRVDAMAPLEKISWSGTNFHFEIVHEDGGRAFAEHGPHSNVTDAVITKHEMHLNVIPSHDPPDSEPIQMTLLGPVRD